ncbi:MAG: glycogen synthase [Deltaproteobacteria bacterium]|nr:glycogen synthase [Deltaproteobacteria bacterium]
MVLVSSEVAPFSKTGGLGDVCGALATGLADAGHRVVTVSPWYRTGRLEAEDTGLRLPIPLAGAVHTVAVFQRRIGRVDHLLVAHPMYDRDGYYGDSGGSFGDNHIRFALLCRAALDAVRRVPLPKKLLGEDVVFHVHDWHAALLPIYLDALYRPVGLFPRAATVLTLHNPAHQGRLPGSLFADLELPPRWFTPSALELHGDLDLLKGGILLADALTTVSPKFAREITTPGGGFGLDGLLRHRADDLVGILNGIDVVTWDPARDPLLPARFSADALTGKATCKAALQAELGLPVAADVPLLGFVGRLDPQKGAELLLESVPWIMDQGAQVVILGSAAAAHVRFEHRARQLEAAYPRSVRAWVGFDEGVSHRVEAGSDLFLMPSLYEPCGLTQMYSMRYGTPPIARRTGCLVDTIAPYDADADADTGTGFLFDAATGIAFRGAIGRALDLFADDPAAFTRLRLRGMAQDFGWERAIPEYVRVYERAWARRNR